QVGNDDTRKLGRRGHELPQVQAGAHAREVAADVRILDGLRLDGVRQTGIRLAFSALRIDPEAAGPGGAHGPAADPGERVAYPVHGAEGVKVGAQLAVVPRPCVVRLGGALPVLILDDVESIRGANGLAGKSDRFRSDAAS